jgi:plastocyanin
MKRRTKLLPVVAGLAAAGVLAGCGGGGEEAAPPPAEAASPPAEAAPPPAAPAYGSGGGTTGAGGASGAEGGTLVATVGPGFTITLTQDGNPVTELPAGTYTIEVSDEADIHNFRLTGPSVEETTGVPETGTTTWTVDLAPGEYTFVCDPHAGSMNGSFTVS